MVTVGPNGLTDWTLDDFLIVRVEEDTEISVLETVGSPGRTVRVGRRKLGRLSRGGAGRWGAAGLARWGLSGLRVLEGRRIHSEQTKGSERFFEIQKGRRKFDRR